MSKALPGVDQRSLDLARHFLSDYAAEDTILADALAERIQAAVEDWMEEWLESDPRDRLSVLDGGRSQAGKER